MVASTVRRRRNPEAEEPHKLSTSINLSEIMGEGLRLEASAYNIDARAAVDAMIAAKLLLQPIFGQRGLCNDAPKPIRTTRRWVEPDYGVPFLSSSDIISIRPQADSYISRAKTRRLSELIIKPWDVLISRSGTVGNVGLASATFVGNALSEDAIRLRATKPEIAAYAAAFLRSRYGRPQIIQATYGSVIKHIEPEHLARVLIPDLGEPGVSIGERVIKAYQLRDEANALLDSANRMLHERLGLPKISLETPQGPVVVCVRASQVSGRFEGNYHNPLVSQVEHTLSKVNTIPLSDRRITSVIRAVTKFRKRVYVRRGGIPMLSSKQLLQIDPVDVKGLAKGAHTKDLPEIALKKEMITVSCSGTIGRVQIIPAYMEGWSANQHALRVIAADGINAGFLYTWLASSYGQTLIRRCSYGSVILEIDREMLGSIPVPYPEASIRSAIGDPVLTANGLRDEAWKLERQAIDDLETAIDSRVPLSMWRQIKL
ncbi:restriction endonuclease subunit S [Alloacidobacterium sp.]|uniref:restriction endonuclease subunit S n=1 Tax=Alloacidobacterium sp. TaxID=2951999 RepID=UPI002D63E06A|nr:restriction endonuclease subunit S [Alloacidobacterium sp.]HYK37037.1 restriction endonuclease subunit S [Alloacidobacterium sp.]